MTKDYKKGILDYISGNIQIENEKPNIFRENETITNNLVNKLLELDITPAPVLYSLRSDNTSNYIVYGEYNTGQNNYSYFAVIDQNGNVVDIITTYESGSLIEEIFSLNYDENGNIYGIDLKDNKYRIVLFNNIAVPTGNKYVCRLRASYYIRNTFEPNVYSENSCIKKVYGEARYFLFGYDTEQQKTELIEFSNIVGVPLEWNYYLGKSIGDNYVAQCDYIIQNQNEKYILDIYYRLPGNISLEHEYFNGEKLISRDSISTPYIPLDIKVETPTTLYVASRNKNSNTNYTLYVHKFVNGSYEELFNYSVNTTSGSTPAFYIALKNGIVFCKNEAMTGSNTYSYTCGAYYNNQFVKSPEYSFTRGFRTTCNIQKTFSLYTFLVQDGNELHLPNVVIYDNQYSGESRSYYDKTLPLHSEIYSNGYIKFARDLYNRQTYENKCISSVNVPFNYLNDMVLSPSNLISSSMINLVSYQTEIEKNKYENMYINYMNEIKVIDEDTNVVYNNTANYINENINTGNQQNYENTFIGKVQVNFSTPQIQNIEWNWNVDHYETSFTIYTNEIPTSIEFKSKDETTTYLIKELSDLSLNKYYTISQKLKIE